MLGGRIIATAAIVAYGLASAILAAQAPAGQAPSAPTAGQGGGQGRGGGRGNGPGPGAAVADR